jgi:hypothetical protein
VDFPPGSDGEVIAAVMGRWGPQEPARLVSLLPPNANLGIYFDCVTNDEFGLLGPNEAFAASLGVMGVEHTFVTVEGGHTDRYPERFAIGLVYLDRLFIPEPPRLTCSVAVVVTLVVCRRIRFLARCGSQPAG